MNRKTKIGLIVLSVFLLLGGAIGGFVWALLQVPDFYEQALVAHPDPVARQQDAKQLVQRTLQLVDEIRYEEEWSEEFTQQQVNSWLAEELPRQFSDLIPKGVSDPRVLFAGDMVQVGFRYDQNNWQGVVSLSARVWVPEPNHLAVEIQSVRAGLVPIPLEEVFDEVSKRFETEGWRTQWHRRDGNDVIVLYLESVGERAPVLEVVDIKEGTVRVSGSRLPPGVERFEDAADDISGSKPIHRLADQSAVDRLADQSPLDSSSGQK